jgi:hypothetical protein
MRVHQYQHVRIIGIEGPRDPAEGFGMIVREEDRKIVPGVERP